MILTALWTGFKVAKGFVSTYKWALIGIAAAGIATSVFVYIDNHGEMKGTITGQREQIHQLIANNMNLESVITSRNNTIVAQNEAIRARIAADAARIAEANRTVVEMRIERDIITEELGIVRFELLEAIRDDEDFADWVDWTVPNAGWSLLRAANEGQ